MGMEEEGGRRWWWVGAKRQQKKQKQWLQFHAQAMEEHTWMVCLLMEALSVSAIPVLVVQIAPNFHLLVLLMLTGMLKTSYTPT